MANNNTGAVQLTTNDEETAGTSMLELNMLGLFTLTNYTRGNEFDCQNALINEEGMLHMHKDKNRFWHKVNLCTKDAKNNSRILVDILLSMVLRGERTVLLILSFFFVLSP